MKDSMSTNDEIIREQTLKSEALIMMEEAHYAHTINDVVELMVNYGQLKVLMDITSRMEEIER